MKKNKYDKNKSIKIISFIEKPKYVLFLILIFALFIRLYFFVGFVNSDPQDDIIYIYYIKDIVDGKHNIKYYSELVKEETINPVHTFKLRNGFLFPSAFFVKIFGYNQIGYTIFPILCSLGIIIIAFLFGYIILKDIKVGALASFLISIYPLDVIYSTRICADVPLAFFVSLSIYFFILSINSNRKNSYNALLGGIFAGVASTIKTFGIILFPVTFVIFLYYYIKINAVKKRMKKIFLYYGLGFFTIFLLNDIYFFSQTGYFLLEPTVNRKVQLDNFRLFPTTHPILENFRIVTFMGDPIEYLRLIFHLKDSRPGINYFGYFYLLLLLSIFIIFIRKELKNEIKILILWIVIGILILELFPIDIRLNKENKYIIVDYMLIPKEARSMSMLTLPTALIIALGLTKIKVKNKKLDTIIICLILLLIFSVSIFNISKISNHFKDGMWDIREASKIIPYLNLSKYIYMDYLARAEIRYFTSFKYDDKIYDFYYVYQESQLKDSYVLVGGSRGSDMHPNVVLDAVPEFLKDIVEKGTDKWVLIKEIRGKEAFYRKYPLRIYYVPND